VVIEKIIHAMKRNIQMTNVERAAQISMAETISNATSVMSDESASMLEQENEADYDVMLEQFDNSLADDTSTVLPEDDTAALVRELEREARELAAVGQAETKQEGVSASTVSLLSSLESKEEETIIDMDHYDTQHVQIEDRAQGEGGESLCSDLRMLEKDDDAEADSDSAHRVSSEKVAESFMEDSSSLLCHPPVLGDEAPAGSSSEVVDRDSSASVVEAQAPDQMDQYNEQRKQLASREAGVFVDSLLSSELLASIQSREELGDCALFEFVAAEAQQQVERMHAQTLRNRLQGWLFLANQRKTNKIQHEQMQQQHARNVIYLLASMRRERMDRKMAKIVNDQNLKYYLFIKSQTTMKSGITALQNSVALKKDLNARNDINLETMKNVLHFKMRNAMVSMLARVEFRSDELLRLKRARKQYNSKLFKKRNDFLMDWLVWTKQILYVKYNACVRIQLCVRIFLAVKRVQKHRQAAKIRENALVECTEIGRTKVLRRAVRRLHKWQKKYAQLRQSREQVRGVVSRPVFKSWRHVFAALRISRTVRGYMGRRRARGHRLRLIRTAELDAGFPVICTLNTQQRAIAHWKKLCGSQIFFRNMMRLALLTKVQRRFAHWKNMTIAYNVYISQHASVIISMARMRLSKKHNVNFHVVRQGVLTFQCVVRSRFAQQVVALLRARMYGSIAIQKVFRGHMCRTGLRQKRIDDIHYSAANNKYERLKYYCEKYFNLTFQPDAEGNFVLHSAAKHAAKRCLKLLIKFHHDPTLVNAEGNTPLHLLVMSTAIHRDSVFEYMLEIGFDEEQFTSDGKSALVLACEYGRSRIVNLCLEHGLDPNQSDYHRTSCLQYAILANFAPIVRTLLLYEADANQAGYEGMSPLHDVASTGNLEIAKILVEESKMETEVDVNIQDRGYGYTPMMVAARSGFDEIVLYFCSLLCSVELVDYSNWTAAHHCALANNPVTVNHLREMVADFDALDFNGNTPLHVAAENGNHEIVRELLSLGAQSSPQNYEGNQPAHLAAKNNHVNCLNFLVRYDEHIGRVNYEHRTPLGMAKFFIADAARHFLEEWFTKLAGPETRNAVGDIWWDAELDGEVGHWTSSTDEANHRVFTNSVTGEVSLDPPRLVYQHVTQVAEKAQAEMRMKVIQNEAENDVNQHVYLEEHALVKKDIEQEILYYDAATVITKTARRKFAYKLYRRKVIETRRQRALTSFFLRALRVLAIRRMLRNTRMWRRVQACWRGYIFRCHFYYWDGTYEKVWYERARRRLAKNVWTLYKDYKFRQMRTTLTVAANAPKMLDEWSEILDRLGHPLRVIGVIEEYLYPDTKNIFFYRNVNTGNIVFQRPKEIEEKDLRDHRDRIMLTEKGFTKSQERLAKKLQSMWRGYKVRTRFRIIIRAKAICVTAEKRFFDHPDNDQHLFNYTLYVQVVLNDYDRARPLYIEMLRKMTHRGPDIAQILYAYAIFSFVVHDQEFEECMSLVERGKVAEEKQYNYLRRQKLKGVDMKGYENYRDIPVSQGSTFELANIGFFHYTTTQKQVSEVYHNYAACTFLIYHNFEKAFDAYLKAFQLDPFNSKARMNYDSMMNFVCGDDPDKVDSLAKARMQVLGDKDHQRRMRADAVRAEAYHRERGAVRIQRWYSHHKGLREYYKFLERLRRKKRRAGLLK
jgi:ankyrin repeat protein